MIRLIYWRYAQGVEATLLCKSLVQKSCISKADFKGKCVFNFQKVLRNYIFPLSHPVIRTSKEREEREEREISRRGGEIGERGRERLREREMEQGHRISHGPPRRNYRQRPIKVVGKQTFCFKFEGEKNMDLESQAWCAFKYRFSQKQLFKAYPFSPCIQKLVQGHTH